MRRRRLIALTVLAVAFASTPALGGGGSSRYDVDVLRRVGGEPSLAVSPDGRTVIVTGGAPSIDGMYRSTDAGRTYQRIRPAFARGGNADLDITFVDDRTVVAVDLSVSGDGILVHRSEDRGTTWSTTAINYDLYDRPWVEHAGRTVYVASRGFDQVPYLFVSTDAGKTFGPPVPVVSTDADGVAAVVDAGTILQHIAVDERSGDLYVLKQHGGGLYVSRLGEGASPAFETHLAAPGASARNGFNWMTVDAAGTVYVLAHTIRDSVEGSVLYFSKDRGVTWSDGVEIGSPDEGRTTAFGAIDGGASGTLAFTYLIGAEGRPSAEAQDWYAEVARVRHADTDEPVLDRARPLAKPVHTEEICSMGLLCGPESNRNLLDYVSTEMTRDGVIYAVVGSDGPATGDSPAVGMRGVTGVVLRSRTR